jgi:biopolymer transport protein ExbD
MSTAPQRFDIWFTAANKVIKGIPYDVVADWIQQGKVATEDRLKKSGSDDWALLDSVPAFKPYFAPSEEHRPQDVAEALEPVELDLDWKKTSGDEDDDVDMIPLIDISLVLLIFFMMTTSVAAISRIKVPEMANAVSIETNPGVLRIDLDQRDDRIYYSIGLGTQAPTAEDDNLESDVELLARLDERLKVAVIPPKVRIAAHRKIPFKVVLEVMSSLERRKRQNQISEYAAEVNERGTP